MLLYTKSFFPIDYVNENSPRFFTLVILYIDIVNTYRYVKIQKSAI